MKIRQGILARKKNPTASNWIWGSRANALPTELLKQHSRPCSSLKFYLNAQSLVPWEKHLRSREWPGERMLHHQDAQTQILMWTCQSARKWKPLQSLLPRMRFQPMTISILGRCSISWATVILTKHKNLSVVKFYYRDSAILLSVSTMSTYLSCCCCGCCRSLNGSEIRNGAETWDDSKILTEIKVIKLWAMELPAMVCIHGQTNQG